ncbi:MAG TPA: hypothetical protein VFA44_00205 [Gaiellaceae bacterium]|nr:hypothetical protein [Gaiellaceae bacterium]
MPSLPRSARFDRDYWLGRCHGYLVDAGGKRLGVVVEVRFGERLDRPAALAIRGGRLGRALTLVAVDDVEEIDPSARRVRVAGRSRSREPRRLERLRRRLPG